jgi:hypothetical protein
MKYKIRTGVSFILTNKTVLTEGIISDDTALFAGVKGANIEAQLWKLEPIVEEDTKEKEPATPGQDQAKDLAEGGVASNPAMFGENSSLCEIPVNPSDAKPEDNAAAGSLPSVLANIQAEAPQTKKKSKEKEPAKNGTTAGVSDSQESDAKATNDNTQK